LMRTCVPTLTEATASFGMISESRVKSSMRSMVTTRVGDDIGGSSARVGEIYSSSAGCVQWFWLGLDVDAAGGGSGRDARGSEGRRRAGSPLGLGAWVSMSRVNASRTPPGWTHTPRHLPARGAPRALTSAAERASTVRSGDSKGEKAGAVGRTGVGRLDALGVSAAVARGRMPRKMFPCANAGNAAMSEAGDGSATPGKRWDSARA
jgi:hypothetical protein